MSAVNTRSSRAIYNQQRTILIITSKSGNVIPINQSKIVQKPHHGGHKYAENGNDTEDDDVDQYGANRDVLQRHCHSVNVWVARSKVLLVI